MKRCRRCVLPETFPSVQLDDDGICQYCRRMPSSYDRTEQRARLRTRFEELVSNVLTEPGYQCLMSWSGGKDSTYTLSLMRLEYKLRVLAVTFDNGFVSPAALDNMRTVADNLGVDHVIVRPRFSLLRGLFTSSVQSDMYPPKALERASAICNTCMGLAKGIALRLALEKDIPMMVYGWSPGQIPVASAFLRPNRAMLEAMVKATAAPLQQASGGEVAAYFPEPRHFKNAPRLPANVSPLIFLDWREDEAVDTIQRFGWQRPDDTDPNSTNCLLNAFANQAHIDEMGYHPYVMELAGLVREGYMDRDEALRRLGVPPSPDLVSWVSERLHVASRKSTDPSKNS